MKNTLNLDKLTPEQKMLEVIEIGGVALEKAASELQAFQQKQSSAQGYIPSTVDALIRGGHVSEEQRATAMSKLASHDVCLQMISKLAAASQTVAPVGSVKAAADTSGQRTKAASETDARFLNLLRGQKTL
jgi:hypothetical protein